MDQSSLVNETSKSEPDGSQNTTSGTNGSTKDDPLPNSLEVISRLKRAIFDRRPILGEIFLKHGNKKLADYANDFFDTYTHSILSGRQEQFHKILHKHITKNLGKKVADATIRQLIKMPLLSTADHHAPIDHPFWVNANIISALPYLKIQKKYLKYLVVLSFSSVSVNNASGFPRGILFHANDDGTGELLRIPFLPDKVKMSTVLGTRGYTKEEVEKAKEGLQKKVKEKNLSEKRAEKISGVIDKYFATPDIINTPRLNDQITKINYALWKDMFHPQSKYMPDLLYIPIEEVTRDLITEHHCSDEHSPIYKMLFAPAHRRLISQYFNNLPGAFSLEKGWGTFLFWGVDDKGHRVRLMLDRDMLISDTKQIAIKLEPATIKEALEKGIIFPSTMVMYIIVSLYYGMKCLGGFCQVNDLTWIKNAWMHCQIEFGKYGEIQTTARIQTKELGGDGLVLAYSRGQNGEMLPATGIDLLISERDTNIDRYVERAKHVTLAEMLTPLLPEMYTVIFSSLERNPELLTVPIEKIIEDTGVKEKLLSGDK